MSRKRTFANHEQDGIYSLPDGGVLTFTRLQNSPIPLTEAEAKFSQSVGLTFEQIIKFRGHSITDMLQLNYMVDFDWLLEAMGGGSGSSSSPLPRNTIILHGLQDSLELNLQVQQYNLKKCSVITLCKPALPIPFGVHHSKAMFLMDREKGYLTIVIHTANLISQDWSCKTQLAYISPRIQLRQQQSTTISATSPFQEQLFEYLEGYNKGIGKQALTDFLTALKDFDYSVITSVDLVSSIPGRHRDAMINKFGHLRLRQLLRQTYPDEDIVLQFSSIGSLGKQSDSWLTGEFQRSLTRSTSAKAPKIIFPSVDNVRLSLTGYEAGGSLPHSSSNYENQKHYFLPLCHSWKCDYLGRSRAMPHVKTFASISPSLSKSSRFRVNWLCLTSSNLSKAAWGCLEKNGSQLMIRSYELGVLVKFQNNDDDDDDENVPWQFCMDRGVVGVPLPYDLPLTKYTKNECPWIWDRNYSIPDSRGRIIN